MAFRFVPCGDRLRPLVEAHVQAVYSRTYGAVIRSFAPLMAADFNDAGFIRCAAGIRLADDGFFSECYVDNALEDILSHVTGEAVGRNRIIEVTNLASGSACSSTPLIENVIAFARQIGTDWAVFTITPRLKRLLFRMKLPIFVLSPANPSRVANPEDWGRYYETLPLVAAMQDPGPSTLALTHGPVRPTSAPIFADGRDHLIQVYG